jgi:hypothetical protein
LHCPPVLRAIRRSRRDADYVGLRAAADDMLQVVHNLFKLSGAAIRF